ncbi:MAG: integrase [Bdellovibrio sp. 28-41-41]|nr:MAG: integrase [Bdellovibrio sp. 28-41-41]
MELNLWVEFFEELQNVRGRSQNTIMAYRRDLELWIKFRQQNPTAPVINFYEHMKNENLSPRSQARVISSIRTYFRFCESKGIKSPELRELKPPKIKLSLPKSLTQDEFQRLFEACVVPDANKTSRNRLTLLLLYGLGCRVTELTGLNVNDFNPTDRWVKILGKGNKERLVPVTEKLAESLNYYLKEVRQHLLKDATPSLLINDRGNRPSRVDVWRWLDAWSTRAEFPETVNPHRFRHGCATALLEGGADLRSIQMLLGHASIQTTQVYTTVTAKSLNQTIDEHHPLSGVEHEAAPAAPVAPVVTTRKADLDSH